jgi:hypothetical protein
MTRKTNRKHWYSAPKTSRNNTHKSYIILEQKHNVIRKIKTQNTSVLRHQYNYDTRGDIAQQVISAFTHTVSSSETISPLIWMY